MLQNYKIYTNKSFEKSKQKLRADLEGDRNTSVRPHNIQILQVYP